MLRASITAYGNAASDDVNYVIDEAALADAAFEAGLNLTKIFSTLSFIDDNSDVEISTDEVLNVVRDVYDATGSDDFDWSDRGAVARALDVMNNMPSVEFEGFVV